jgi:transposase
MGLGRYVVDAVLAEGRSAREVAEAHGISKSWIYELIARYRAGGYEALEPRSRRPRCCTHETPVEIVQAIVALRCQLAADGHDAARRRSLTTSPSRWMVFPRAPRSGGSSGARA